MLVNQLSIPFSIQCIFYFGCLFFIFNVLNSIIQPNSWTSLVVSTVSYLLSVRNMRLDRSEVTELHNILWRLRTLYSLRTCIHLPYLPTHIAFPYTPLVSSPSPTQLWSTSLPLEFLVRRPNLAERISPTVVLCVEIFSS